LVVLALLLGTTLWLYRATGQGMVSLWLASDTYAHGFVVPIISLWLVWRLRGVLADMVPQTSWAAVGLAVVVVLGWSAGDLVAVNSVTQLALVTLLILWVVALLGWRVSRVIAFPLAFLYFAVPIGDFLLPQMMEWTADFTVLALRASGIPVYREGLQFIIPSGSWSVVEACSGIRYLIASLTVGCLFAYLSFNGWRKRLIFVGFALLVPLVANWMRAYMIVMIGHLSGNELATGVDHLVYGWVFFGLVILVMLMIGARFADAPVGPVVRLPAAQRGAGMSRPSGSNQRLLVALTCLVVALIPQGAERWLALGNKTAPVIWSPVTAQAPWQRVDEQPAIWKPAFQFASAELPQNFVAPDASRVGTHLSYYRQQDYQRKLVTSSNVLVTSKDPVWAQLSQGSASASLPTGDLVVSSAVLSEDRVNLLGSRERLLVWRFYWVDDTFTSSDLQAKLRGAWGQVAGRGDDGAIVTLYTRIDSSAQGASAEQAAKERLGGFLRTHSVALRQALEATRAGR
jgi:exosortase A